VALPAGKTAQRMSIEGGDSDEVLAASSTHRRGHRFAFSSLQGGKILFL
jgi:hypothetical protein